MAFFVQVRNCGNTWIDITRKAGFHCAWPPFWVHLNVTDSFATKARGMTKYCDYLRGIIFVWVWPDHQWPCHNCKQNCGNAWKQEKLYSLRDLLDNGFSCYSSRREDKVQCAVIMSEFYIFVRLTVRVSPAGPVLLALGCLKWVWPAPVSGLWMSATGQPTLNTDNCLNMTLMSTLLRAESGDMYNCTMVCRISKQLSCG